ncbi:transcriptional repressor proteinral negative regulator of transcription subunit 4 [Sporothrix epigloea]|uniref:Transcriptional repressor proteinral negative regulator of transcription subunit 4 n=1 Tax=Sporothrix epigloea TaxID=1892477 RepID=A0ABP0DW32_9PEZI
MAPQDTFIDDEEDTCPLCIEEFDLSDRASSIARHAEFRSNIQKNQKKRAAEQRQKEVQKREAEKENRKNLVGVRVVQKNLVYVTGLNPTVREDELLKTLRKAEFFGQYGNIQKISISNRKSPDGSPSLGIYVTFEKKEDAQRCILAVNGSMNGERSLKAQLGTTKYCSAWLRHEQCTNRQCMFLHELGDEEDSYTRQDLSSMNSISTQRPFLGGSSSRSASRQQSHPIPVPTSASQPMVRSSSRDESENGDSSALPAAASWARSTQVRSRRGSHATSGAAPSPAISMALPVTTESVAEAAELSPRMDDAAPAAARAQETAKATKNNDLAASVVHSLLLAISNCALPSTFLTDGLTLDAFPPLFDPLGGEKRRALRDDESRIGTDQDDQEAEAGDAAEGEPESSGSLALGGEPEDREHTRSTHGFDQRRGGPLPIQRSNADNLFGPFDNHLFPSSNPGTIGNRSSTPQQSLYSRTPGSFVDHPPPGIATSQSQLFQGQTQNRQSSRYGFADTTGGAAAIKLAANPRIMAQQSMPPSLHSQPSPFYAASMPGPPPGLKSTGTPPAGFGQNFTNTAFGGAPKDTSQLLQDIIRGRGSGGSGSQAHDSGKHDELPAMDDVVSTVDALVSDEPTVASYPYGTDSPLRSGTPSFPPGFGHIQPLQHPMPPFPTAFSRPMTPVRFSTPTNSFSLPRLKSSTSVMAPTEPAFDKETPDALEQQQQSIPLPGSRGPSRTASGTASASDLIAAMTGSSKSIRTIETATVSSTLATHEPSVPATPISNTAKKASSLQDEDFPALDAAVSSATKSSANAIQTKPSKPPTPARKKTTEKRPAPTLLNISASTRPMVAKDLEESPVASEKHTADLVAFPSLPTPSASSASAIRSVPQHKTVRVVQASKPEVASAGPASLSIVAAEDVKNAGSSSSTPNMAPAALASRQSTALLANRPSTPASEIVSISDNASVISASISASRAGSPPPSSSRIGSAAVRTTTKSQQRKQRKQATKIDVAAVVEAVTTTSSSIIGPSAHEQEEESAEIVPIVGRKKKQKKEKPAPTPAASAEINATISNSAPNNATKEQKEAKVTKEIKETKEFKETKETKIAKPTATAKREETASEKTAVTAAKTAKTTETSKASLKNSAEPNATAVAPPERVAVTATAAPAATETPARRPGPAQGLFEKEHETLQTYLREAAELSGSRTLGPKESPDSSNSGHAKGTGTDTDHWARFGGTVHSVVQKMASLGLIGKNVDDISLLKPFTKLSSPRDISRKHPIQGDVLLPPDVLFRKDDLSDIAAGKAVHKNVDDVRILATPNGDCLRNLSEAEEERFMTLQSVVGKSLASPLSYMHPRYEETGGFSLVSKRAIPCGMPSYYPVKCLAPPGTAGQIIFDPLSKIQREEAVYWINQYVLPRLNLLPQSEAASWQSMLVDTGVPQAIGTTTLAPWIYHTPDVRYGIPASGAVSSRVPADSVAATNHANGPAAHGESTVSAPLPYPTRYTSRYGPVNGRDGIDLRKDLDCSVHAMSVEDAERSLIEARREVKVFERALVQLVKINEMLLKSDDHLSQLAVEPECSTGSGSGPAASPAPVGAEHSFSDCLSAAVLVFLRIMGCTWLGLGAILLALRWLRGCVLGVAEWVYVEMVQLADSVLDLAADLA